MMEGNTPNEGRADTSIRFNCSFCGQRIRIPSIHAGKKGKCPKCGKIVLVPQLPALTVDTVPVKPANQEPDPFSELLLKRPPQPERVGALPPETPKDDQFEMLRQSAGLSSLQPEPPPERKYHWLIDIFLYPANLQGLIFLAIAVLVPLVIRMIAVILCVFGLLFSLINFVIVMYIYWFLAQCVRDSAAGGLRAPETISETPGIWELLWQLFELFACFAVCAAPAAFYLGYTRRFDAAFWLLAGGGAFLYPMTLLAVIMFDSINGLNPLIVVPSIFSTFFQYCGLVVLISAIIFLCIQTANFLPPNLFMRIVLSPVIQAVELYFAMVAAHLLGRFFFKYQGKLNWEV